MFKHAPSDIFLQSSPPLDPPIDFYIESEPVTSASEDLSSQTDVSFKLADFGVDRLTGYDTPYNTSNWTNK